MNHIVTYLESKQAIFHGVLILMMLYVPHAGNLFMQLEHLDMTFSGYTFLNWIYGVCLAAVIEFVNRRSNSIARSVAQDRFLICEP
jgi:hypothetical protein